MLGTVPASAQAAGSVSIEGTTMVIRVAPGTTDDFLGLDYSLKPAPPCVPTSVQPVCPEPSPTPWFGTQGINNPDSVEPCKYGQCPATGITAIEAFLGDGVDRVRFLSSGWTADPSDTERTPFPVPITVHGEAGLDKLQAGDYPIPKGLTLDGGADADGLEGSNNPENTTTLIGGEGNDGLGSARQPGPPVGVVHFFGGPGNDQLIDGVNPQNTLEAGDGDDEVYIESGYQALPSFVPRTGPPALISCGAGNDRIGGDFDGWNVLNPLPAGVAAPEDCEIRPGSAPKPTTPGGQASMQISNGRLQPGGKGPFHDVKSKELVTAGSVIDATKSSVEVQFVAKDGVRRTTKFFGGQFKVSQAGSAVAAKLLGTPSCPKGAKTSGNRKRPRLTADGPAQIIGRYATVTAGVNGKFLVEERCEGTWSKSRSPIAATVTSPKGKTVATLGKDDTHLSKAKRKG